MKYKYVLLDWDGCLAKTLDIWLKVYKDIVNKRGIKVTDELDFVEKSFGKWEKGFENVDVEDPVVAYKEALANVEKEMLKVELYPNAKELLEQLKKNGAKLALLTSSFRHLIDPALKKYDLDSYFDYTITKDETEIGKPDPWIVNAALDHLKGSADEAIIIGDSDHDILTGHNSKIPAVLYYPEHNNKFYRKEFLMKHNPDHVISDLLELVDIVK